MDKKMNKILEEYIIREYNGVFPDGYEKEYANFQLNADLFHEILDTINKFKKIESNTMFLDVGCGVGSLILSFKRAGACSVGIDTDQNALLIARKRLNEYDFAESAHLVLSVGEELPFKNNTFDVITTITVLEHVKDPKKAISECLRILKPKGILYIFVPNYMSFWEGHYKMLWLPLFPKSLAKVYLKLRNRNPTFLDSINYITPKYLLNILDELKVSNVHNLSIERFFWKINNPKEISYIKPLIHVISTLNRFKIFYPMVWILGKMGLYTPIILIVEK
jgi:ubiquinone/menaquinone biosynthesis C-methylase UbiE